MGLFDSIVGAVLGGGAAQGGQSTGQAALINAVIQMIANRQGGSSVAGGGGGLGGLLDALHQGGLGQAATSWVSSGHNLPVTADQLQQALGGAGGGGLLGKLAEAAGMSHSEAASHLSQVLPGLVDHMTPDGQVPHPDALDNMLGAGGIGSAAP